MSNRESIRAFVAKDIMRGEDPSRFDDEFDLIDSGVLDSLAMMQLVTFLEREFAIKVDTADIVPDNFGSIGRLAAYVQQKTSA
jgi:acyl carrier protein